MKRIVLFVLTNLAVMLVLSVAVSLLGLNKYITAAGLNLPALLGFCAVFGFAGSFISLLISKPVAKWSTGARVVDGTESSTDRWLVATVQELSEKAGIQCPEVAVYEGEPNAFATGAFRNSALVAVSTGLLQSMRQDEVRAVLAHEVAHVANGDMQTMTLLQGVMNTFVMFIARVVGYAVDKVVLRNSEEGRGAGYMVTVLVLDLVLGVLASMIVMAFSRHREYRADWHAAELMGSAAPMQAALARLESVATGELPKQVAAFGISGRGSEFLKLFSSHPPLQERIQALESFRR